MVKDNQQHSAFVSGGAGRASDEMRAVCGDTVAVILAMDTSVQPVEVTFEDLGQDPITCTPAPERSESARPIQMYGGSPLVAHAVKAAARAQVAMIYVLTDPSISADVAHAAHSVRRRRNDPLVEVLAVEQWALDDRTNEAGGFGLLGIPFGTLEVGRMLANDSMGGYGSVLFLPADLARVTAEQIYELCSELSAKRPPDVVTSLMDGVRRPPFLFRREFLDGLEDSGIMDRASAGDAQAKLVVRDHVVSGELLAPRPADS